LAERLPLDAEPRAPAPREPARRGLVEAEVDDGARDAAVGERLAVPAQIAPALEPAEHPLDRGGHVRIVGIGAKEAQAFVQLQDMGRARQFGPLESGEPCELALRPPGAELHPDAFETAERR